jgi:diguanylate cyclase (GGDEF)-like protein
VLVALCLFVLLFVVVVELSSNLVQQHSAAIDGRLDLTELDLANSNPVPLSGKWDFYWQQFVLPDRFESEQNTLHDQLQTPLSWAGQNYLGKEINAHGYGTYRLRINIPPTSEALALYVPIIGSAYRLYVNQQLVDQAGNIASDKDSSVPEYAPKILPIGKVDGQLDIVLHISNYEMSWGGQLFPITLATVEQQFQTQLKKLVRSVSISAIFFTIAILSLFHFALRPSDVLPFLLALTCLCLGLREVETSHLLYLIDSLKLSFNAALRINFLTFYLAIPLFTGYFRSSYPAEFRLWPVRLIFVFSAFFVVLTLVTSPAVFSQFLVYFQYFALLVMLYARLIAVGSIVLFALGTNDILNSMGLIHTLPMAGFGLLSFALCQNYLTYVRFIKDSMDMHTFSVQANQDPLTLLLNRRGLMEAIKQNVSEQRQDLDHLCVLLIDFDHFKQLNDTLGHDAGDLVLAEGGKIMSNVIRKQDIAARWGGEEFVVILPNTEEKGALNLAEKLRVKLSKELSEKLKHSITVSIGVSQCSHQENFSTCLKRADKALYQAKENGRNRVILAPFE